MLRKQERRYLETLERNLMEFCHQKAPASIEEIYLNFGLPQDVVHTYYCMSDDLSFFGTVHVGRLIRKSACFIGSLLLISVLFLGAMLFWEGKSISETRVFYVTTEITEDLGGVQ